MEEANNNEGNQNRSNISDLFNAPRPQNWREVFTKDPATTGSELHRTNRPIYRPNKQIGNEPIAEWSASKTKGNAGRSL